MYNNIIMLGAIPGAMVGEVAVNIMIAAGVLSVGVSPSRKTARHTTTVPLYCDSAGMVSVSILLPCTLIDKARYDVRELSN